MTRNAASPLAGLGASERSELFEDVNYLNLTELRTLCRTFGIPYRIRAEQPDGRAVATRDSDRKGVVLHRLRHFLQTGERLPATTLSASVVGPPPPPGRPDAHEPVLYGAYQRGNASVLETLGDLTGGRFRDGARARTLLMAHWATGRAPTFADFAAEWLAAEDRRDSLVAPEYAYLTDLQRGTADAGWKRHRRERAQRALARIERCLPTTGSLPARGRTPR